MYVLKINALAQRDLFKVHVCLRICRCVKGIFIKDVYACIQNMYIQDTNIHVVRIEAFNYRNEGDYAVRLFITYTGSG